MQQIRFRWLRLCGGKVMYNMGHPRFLINHVCMAWHLRDFADQHTFIDFPNTVVIVTCTHSPVASSQLRGVENPST